MNARSWLADVREHADPHLTCILVGNKIDLCTDDAGPGRRTREVPSEEAEQWAQEEGLLFVEASARSGENVEAAFERATRDILDKIRRGVFDDDRVRGPGSGLITDFDWGCSRPASSCRNRRIPIYRWRQTHVRDDVADIMIPVEPPYMCMHVDTMYRIVCIGMLYTTFAPSVMRTLG